MSAESPEVPHFDAVAIDKLRNVAGDQGAAFVAEIAQLFLDETAKSLADLARARDLGDWRLVSRIAHSLKSSAATLGLMRMSAACKALELDTKAAASTPETAKLADDVFDQFEKAKPTLHELW